jgi:hypothetical protein
MGVFMVWAGLLEKPLEVVSRRPHWMLVTTRGGRDTPLVGVVCLLVVSIITAGRGHSPLKALFACLGAASNLPGIMSGDARGCLLVTARCRLPASLCRAMHGRLSWFVIMI